MFTDRLFGYTTLVVLSVHLCALSWLVQRAQPHKFDKPKEKFVVKTVALKPPVKKEKKPPPRKKQTAVAAPPKKNEVKKAPSLKKPPPKKPAPKKTASAKESKKAQKPKQELTKKEQLLQKAKENLAKLQQGRATLSASKNTTTELEDVGVISSLNIDKMEASDPEESAYLSVLAGRLKETLRLPEMGSVRVRLLLNRAGHVVNMETVSSESEYNRKFIEATIKKVRFPPFGKSFKGEESHSFTITLENET